MSTRDEWPVQEPTELIERPGPLVPEQTDVLPVVDPAGGRPPLDGPPADEPPPARNIGLGMLLALVVVALALGAAAAAYLLTRDDGGKSTGTTTAATIPAAGDRTTVPQVVGYKATRAIVVLGEAHLKPKLVNRPTKKPTGLVVSQRPSAGTELDSQSQVTLVVDAGVPVVALPDLTGTPFAEAAAALRKAGLEPRQTKVASDQDPGTVVEQSPAAGTKAKRGSTVLLSVAKAAQVPVPDVVGRQSADAESALQAAGLGFNRFAVPSTQPEGVVVAQRPGAGLRAERGSKVRLNVSSGAPAGGSTTQPGGSSTQPGGSTTKPGGSATGPTSVPDVVGMGQTDAAKAFQKAGLLPSVVYVPSQEPANTVVAQAKQPGTTLKRGTHVQINVSRGRQANPDQAVPDVVGQNEAGARQSLEDAGFTVAVLDQATTDPAQDGIVLDEQPQGGRQAPEGSQVTIFVGRIQSG